MSSITSTTPTSAEEDNFFAATTNEIILLLAIIIFCPIFIAIFCWWQKSKTRKFAKERQERSDKLMASAAQRREIQMAHQQQRQTNSPPMNGRMISHGNMQESHVQNQRSPLNNSMARPQHIASDPSSDHEGAGGLAMAPSAPRAPSMPSAVPPKSRQKSVKNDKARISIINYKNRENELEKKKSVLQKKEDGTFSSKGVPPPPSNSPPKVNEKKKQENKRDVVLDMLVESPSGQNQPPPAWTSPPKSKPRGISIGKKKKAPNFMKVQSLSDAPMVKPESALVLPDVEDDVDTAPPQSIPRTKTFDAQTGAPIDENNDGNNKNKNRDRIETEDIEKSISIPDQDEKKGNDGNMSDSSSGEALDANDNNLLKIAHDQMQSQPPPSLQTIFGRRVNNENDESESEDSLMKRQEQYKHSDAPDEVGSPPDKPESTFILNV